MNWLDLRVQAPFAELNGNVSSGGWKRHTSFKKGHGWDRQNQPETPHTDSGLPLRVCCLSNLANLILFFILA